MMRQYQGKRFRDPKILLIFPPGVQLVGQELKKCTPPLGLMYIASYLEKYGYEVGILDTIVEGYTQERRIADDVIIYGLSDQEIVSRIQEFGPDIVGISWLFSSLEISVRHVAKLVKDVDPSIVVIIGGSHPSMTVNALLSDTNLDFIVIGEGEATFLQLLQVLESGDNLEKVDGLAWREESSIRVTPKSNYIENLDSLPFPARHLVPLHRYSELRAPHGDLLRVPYTPMITSRGCPGRCTFCLSRKLWGPRYRYRSVSNMLEEMIDVITRYSVREIHFEDDNLTANPERAAELFRQMMALGMDLVWVTPNGLAVNTLNESLLSLMKASGCYSVSLAIESGSKEVLEKIIRKPVDLDKARRLVKYAKSIGLRVTGFFVIGFPGETRKQIMETVSFIEELDFDSVGLMIATPYPGTELLQICTRENLLTVEAEKIDYLRLRHSKGARGIIKTDEFDPGYLEQTINDWSARRSDLAKRKSKSNLLREWNSW